MSNNNVKHLFSKGGGSQKADPFSPSQWLSSPTVGAFAKSEELQSTRPYGPTKYLLKGWEGDGLLGPSSIKLVQLLKAIKVDAILQFKNFQNANKSIKQFIFQDFRPFLLKRHQKGHELDHIQNFWPHLFNEHSPFSELLDEFKELFCFRASAIYFLKVRFTLKLDQKTGAGKTNDAILFCNSYLEKVFKKGSSSELLCEALQTNPFSWYRPGKSLGPKLLELSELINKTSITQLNKILSMASPDVQKSEYSHALSHKSFGSFISDLLVNFPKWLEEEKLSDSTNGPKAVNTKFVGNYLDSLSQAHWLAQEANNDNAWDKIICPDFYEVDFVQGSFTKICQELRFLHFLLDVAEGQGHDYIPFLCHIVKQKYAFVAKKPAGQISLFPQYEIKSDLVYDRVILNATNSPKKNAYHDLLARITHNAQALRANGHLFVFSDQKLFVPSQSEKLNQLTLGLKLEGAFCFSELKGRGELPANLYIFKKRSEEEQEQSWSRPEQESFLSFIWSGELSTFSVFEQLVEQLKVFFQERNISSTPIYQAELPSGMFFDYHQDALIKGKAVSSLSQEKENLAHPTYFRKLTQSCLTLEQFFQLETIEHSGLHQDSSSFGALLGLGSPEFKYPLAIVVDYSRPDFTQVEIISSDMIKGKIEKLGTAYYSYFGLLPKKRGLPINGIRQFLKTGLGFQIIQLCLSGGPTKLKGRLRGLLIPKFFLEARPLPEEWKLELAPLQTFLELQGPHEAPTDLFLEAICALEKTRKLPSPYWASIFSLLTQFKIKLEDSFPEGSKHSRLEVFSHPRFYNQIAKSELSPLFPQHEDIYVELLAPADELQSSSLSTTIIEHAGENTPSELKLISADDNPLVLLRTTPELAELMSLIFEQAKGQGVYGLLMALKFPYHQDVAHHLHQTQEVFNVSSKLNQVITSTIEGMVKNSLS